MSAETVVQMVTFLEFEKMKLALLHEGLTLTFHGTLKYT